MNNYQLYRTNVKLGGQVSWNLVLKNDRVGNLEVSYFDVTPISEYTNYKYGQNRNCLKYSHQENVRELYKEIKGQFYDACIDPQLKTIYPIIGTNIKTRDNSLEMGCTRISYKRYNKQFQFFCPLWLEDFSEDRVLHFVISLCTYETNKVIATKTLSLESGKDNYHNQFVDYLNNYVKSLKKEDESVIGDDILNIDLTDSFASIHGLDIGSGDLVTKDISEIVPNLYNRERPMMETDYVLIDNFHTKQMITKQLFNFNLVFSITDLVTDIVDNMLKDDDFSIRLEVYCTDKNIVNPIQDSYKLQLKSFDSDYSSLKQYNQVTRYLKDDKYIDFVHKNKLAPDICHWVLNDNNEYVFNLYPGFGTSHRMFYKDSPNYWETNTKLYTNALNWCNFKRITNGGISEAVYDYSKNIDECTIFETTKSFINNTRFNLEEVNKKIRPIKKEYLKNYILSNYTSNKSIDSETMRSISDKFIFIKPKKTTDGEYMNWPDVVSLDMDSSKCPVELYVDIDSIPTKYSEIYKKLSELGSNEDEYMIFTYLAYPDHYSFLVNTKMEFMLTYKYIKNIFRLLDMNIFKKSDELVLMKDIMSNVIEPKVVYIYNTLKIAKADSPVMSSSEVYYVKNNESTKVIRYDGKIKPRFVEFSDLVLYQIKNYTQEQYINLKPFKKENTKGFLPYFPSINYYNLKTITGPQRVNEFKWFDKCRVFNLRSNIETKIRSVTITDSYYNNEYLIDLVINNTYPNLYDTYKEYLRSLYNADVEYEYDTPAYDPETEKFNYVYTIKLNLK